MALEDAIETARKAASWEEQRLRNARAHKAAQDTELKAVLAEAVNRLRSFEGLTLRRCESCTSWFGADRSITDGSGQRFRRVSERQCWIIVECTKTPVLLTEDGKLGRITEKNALRCSTANVFAVRGPLESARDESDFRSRTPIPGTISSYEVGDFDLAAVKRTLGKAIVAHEKKSVRKTS
ncbi:hypothetical protein [Mycobacterium intracellulare]|uniref:hypothetical protein n=1 Tax=Mycobacterium intracellulare TaxID=1767 RepID=UPI00109EDB67|nr:hypothetical protein [Mycobacterium intracellulare]